MTTSVGVTAQPPVADMLWLSHFVGKQKKAVILSLLSGMVGGVTLALEPYVVGVIIDHMVNDGVNIQQIGTGIGVILALAAVTVSMFFVQRHYAGVIAYAVHQDVRSTLFNHLVELDHDFYKRYTTGDLISRMYSDLEWIWRLLAIGFTRGGNAIAGAVVAFTLLATIDLRLTLIVFITIAISTAVQMRAGLFIVPIMERQQNQQGKMTAFVQDMVTGIQTVKTFGREAEVAHAFQQENDEFRRRWLRMKRRNEPIGMIPQMIIYLTQGVVVLIGGQMTINGGLTLGNFTQFLLYLGLIGRVLLPIGIIYQRYMQTRGALQRISPLLQLPSIRDPLDAQATARVQGEIIFENVGLQEDGQWLLRHINLTIPCGKVIALVGPTGGGKTLLVNLLSRVSDVSEGRVLIDGRDVRGYQLEALRRNIAYVPQQTFLFSQPLHENVRMGQPQITEEELLRAVHISRISNDLPDLADGLETLVGEKGVMLSGGQKQRVAIARAVVRDPAILILDDALSSVDTQTAAEILGELRNVLQNRTSIIIAHRIATVKDTDLIVVVDHGKIVEQGTHDTLIAAGKLYAHMVEREAQQEGDFIE
ncbi:MAG: ABC transporter ATP-binding protein [Phototrophicaceae bacterium]